VGDIIYFSGLIEGFGEFCHEHGLEIITNESDENLVTTETMSTANVESIMSEPLLDEKLTTEAKSNTNDDAHIALNLDGKIRRSSKESPAPSDEATRLRSINLMSGTYQLGACCHSSSPKLTRFM
jgi:hypothetical protein